MGIRYKIKFDDTQGKYNHELDLIDTSYTSYSDRVEADGGTVTSIECLPDEVLELVEYKKFSAGSDGYTLEYGKRGEDPLKPIKGSRLTFQLMAEDADDIAFIDDLASTQEQTYYVRLKIDGSLYWQGPVLQDLVRVPFNSLPTPVEIQATDGLARLKGIEEEITEYDNALEAVITVLKGLDTGNLWASSDNFLRTVCKWSETQTYTGTPANTYDTLEYTRIDALGVQYTENEQGEKEYRSHYDYLENLLKVIGARIFLADGVYCIEQIDQIENGGTNYFNLYQKGYSIGSDANPSTATGVTSRGSGFFTSFALNATGTTNRVVRDCSWTYIPAAKEYRIKFNTDNDLSVNVEWMRLRSTTYTMRSLEEDTSAGVRFRTEVGYHRLTNASIIDANIRLVVVATIKLVGSSTYYLSPAQSSQQATWTTSPATVFLNNNYYTIPQSSSLDVDPFYQKVRYFSTPDIPIDGDIEVSYTATVQDINNQPSGSVTVGTVTGQFSLQAGVKVGLTISNPQGVELTGKSYSVQNSVETNATVENDLGEVFIADKINSANIPNKIKVYDPTAPGVPLGKFVDSSSWTVLGVGSGVPVLELLLTSAMQLFEKPRRLFDLRYYGAFDPIRAFELNSRDYFWNWLKLTASENFIESEAYELSQTATAQTVDNDDTYQDRQITYSVPSVGDYQDPGDLGNGLSNPIGGLITAEVTGTTTSIPVGSSLVYDLGYSGETVSVQRTDGSIETFVLSADALAGDTSISVVSQSVTNAISEGSRVLSAFVNSSTRSKAREVYSLDSIPDPTLILENKGTGLTGANLTSWKDQSGNANNFTGVSLEPNYDGVFQVYFDGTAGTASNATISQSSGYTIVFLIKLEETATGRYIIYGNSGNVYLSTASGDNVTLGTSTKSVTAEIVRGEWVVFQARMDGASSEWRTGYNSWTAANLDADTLETPKLGSDGTTNYCEMRLAAACIFAYTLSDNQANAVVTNLKSRI